ncbi:MAG: hypothetical protein GY864_12250 [Desulfobacterales bacterium]|nr:hypothetical protein [Desulfobacterales bacterium]
MLLRLKLIPALLFFLPLLSAPLQAQEELILAFNLENIPLTGCLEVAPDKKTCLRPVAYTKFPPLSWKEAQSRFDIRQQIPDTLEDDLHYKDGLIIEKDVTTVDLSLEVPKWLSKDFRDPDYGAHEPWVQSVGNILQTFSAHQKDEEAQEALLKRLKKEFPLIWEEVKNFLPEWVLDSFLYSDEWNPYKRGSSGNKENDGMLERPPFLLTAGIPRGKYPSAEKERKIFQACAPIYAPLEIIMAIENDFQNFTKQKGASFLEVYPLEESCFSGNSPAGNPFFLYDISNRQQPFPGWNLYFVLRHFIHNEGGRWIMEKRLVEGSLSIMRNKVYFDPISTTEGKVIGFVLTKWVDLDIRNIPDRDKDRMSAAKCDLGNVKRIADELTILKRKSTL